MEELMAMIEDFRLGIYLNMPSKLQKDYVHICEYFAMKVDESDLSYDIKEEIKSKTLIALFDSLSSRDFVRMADSLEVYLKPAINSLGKKGLN